jgi:hypothetical protein
MDELTQLKSEAEAVMMGISNSFVLISHEFIKEDIWLIIVESTTTGNIYSFESEGSKFNNFKQMS